MKNESIELELYCDKDIVISHHGAGIAKVKLKGVLIFDLLDQIAGDKNKYLFDEIESFVRNKKYEG